MKQSKNLINGILCCLNPRFNISSNHYVCGSNLAIFTSIAQVENCLTGITNKCKCFTNFAPKLKNNNCNKHLN